MPDGRGARIALEAGFLVAVAAVLGFADVRPLWIVLVMTIAWVVVALLEWVAWREEPHWASGSPPRYYVPPQPLPPRPPSEELPAFSAYPRAPAEPRATEAPTWIATPEMREELLGWPAPEPRAEPEPEPVVAHAAPEPEPVAAQAEPEPEPEELQQELLTAASAAAEPEAEPEPEEQAGGWPIDDGDTETDPWVAADLGEEQEPPGDNLSLARDVDSQEPPSDNLSLARDADSREPSSDNLSLGHDGASDEEPVPVQAAGARLARHRIDPFDAADGRRWPWQRRAETHGGVAELPPLPRHVRLDAEDER